MKWFNEKEFACRCCGQLPPFARENTEALVSQVLDPLRERYGRPIYINSGYRCTKHNREVGGVTNSQHLIGEAADIHCADNRLLERLIEEQGRFDQLNIYPIFLHVSWRRRERTGGRSYGHDRYHEHHSGSADAPWRVRMVDRPEEAPAGGGEPEGGQPPEGDEPE